jgi:hypothetical protein
MILKMLQALRLTSVPHLASSGAIILPWNLNVMWKCYFRQFMFVKFDSAFTSVSLYIDALLCLLPVLVLVQFGSQMAPPAVPGSDTICWTFSVTGCSKISQCHCRAFLLGFHCSYVVTCFLANSLVKNQFSYVEHDTFCQCALRVQFVPHELGTVLWLAERDV